MKKTQAVLSGLSSLAAILSLVPAAVGPSQAAAATTISNPSFETGNFSGWTVTVPPGGSATIVPSYTTVGGASTTLLAVDGARFSVLKTNGPGSYTTVSQTFAAAAGDSIAGHAFFDSAESSPSFNDNAQVRVRAGATIVATPFDASVASVGGPGHTPWTEWSHRFGEAGTYTIEARVTNAFDSQVDSRMGLDHLAVSANRPPDCANVVADRTSLWPPNREMRTLTLSGASDPDADAVTLAVTGVIQDEPVNGLGDGDASPDAVVGAGSNQVQVRAERSGTGDGRVYKISFVASDPFAASCSAEVIVEVPHSKNGQAAIAGSFAFDSTLTS